MTSKEADHFRNSWKVRFLVQTHKFLDRLLEIYRTIDEQKKKSQEDSEEVKDGDEGGSSGEKDAGKGKKPLSENDADPGNRLTLAEKNVEYMRKVAEFQLKRIKEHVESVVQYLVRAMLEPGSKTTVMPDCHIAGESNYFYVMITIWYVTKNFPDWDWDWKDRMEREEWKKRPRNRGEPLWSEFGHLFDSNRLPSHNWTFRPWERDKIPLLKWFHHGSVLKLCDKGFLPASWRGDNLESEVFQLAKAAKISAATKLASQRPYAAEDEIVDRLSFLADELGLEHLGPLNTVSTVTSITIKRIRQRDFTRALNPGWRPNTEEGFTSGPWEIHALCHHSRLAVFLLDPHRDSEGWKNREHAANEAESFKRKLCRFLNGEGILIPTWERSHSKARKGWLLSEASAVVATTLLAMHEDGMSDEPTASTEDSGANLNPTNAVARVGPGEKKLVQEVMYVENLLKEQLDVLSKFTEESTRLPPINWETFAPPRRYHPLSFFNSLEDTAELYRYPQLNKVKIPRALDGFATLHWSEGAEFKRESLEKDSILEKLFVSDILATGRDQYTTGFDWEHVPFKYEVGSTTEAEKKKSRNALFWALYDSVRLARCSRHKQHSLGIRRC